MCPSHDLGTVTIDGRFRIRGLLKVGFVFIWMGIKEIFNRIIKFRKSTADLLYGITAEVDIKKR